MCRPIIFVTYLKESEYLISFNNYRFDITKDNFEERNLEIMSLPFVMPKS